MTRLATKQVTIETAYGITSLSPERGSAKQLLEWAQNYWGIENGLHYRPHVTLLEDATRLSNVHSAQAIAVLNNFIVALISKMGLSYLASAQRNCDSKLTPNPSVYGRLWKCLDG